MRRFLTLMVATMLAGQAWAKDFTVDNNAAADTAKQTGSVSKMDTSFWRFRFKRYKTESASDTNGNVTLAVCYKWNRKTKMWENDVKLECDYNAKGQQTLYVEYLWNGETNSWRNRLKEVSAYDTTGQQTLDIGGIPPQIYGQVHIRTKRPMIPMADRRLMPIVTNGTPRPIRGWMTTKENAPTMTMGM